MSAILTILMLVILLACVATTYAEGTWSNAVRLINVVTAAILAINFFEPVARWLDSMMPSFTFLWDFIAIWGLFGLFTTIFRELTDRISRVQVKFLKVADRIGSSILALWIGWVMVCFTITTLHTAPLARTFLFDNFQPEESMILGRAPDRQLLGFVQKLSLGAYARSATPAELQKGTYGKSTDPNDPEAKLCVFDRYGGLLPKYATRRAILETKLQKDGSLLQGP
jgi:hypothetical protein